MNDETSVDRAASAQPGTDTPTAGALLRRAREAAGLHVAALAVALKVPVKKLEALEADRWDLLPDAVFVRALASSVCRSLKINPVPVLDRLPQQARPRLDAEERGINTPFRASGYGSAGTVSLRFFCWLRLPSFWFRKCISAARAQRPRRWIRRR